MDIVPDGVHGVQGLYGARAVVVSPDGAHAYITGGFDDGAFALTVFGRDAATGKLTRVEEALVSGWTGLADVWRVTVSPDGAHVYVTRLWMLRRSRLQSCIRR